VLENTKQSDPPSGDRLPGVGEGVSATDAELLQRFASRRDEEAFTALVERHGRMVLRVCRQMLRNADDADDAFQAVWLVLVRRAGQIRRGELLSGWLYGVALRVSAKVREQAARRRREGQGFPVAELEASNSETPTDLQPLLHEEINRLPEYYRNPVVLCYIESKTNEQAARELRCPVGTVKGRLARARELLKSRLRRRGVTPGLLAGLSLESPHDDPQPPPRLLSSLEAALRNGKETAATGPIALLAQSVLGDLRRRTIRGRWRLAAIVVMSAAALGLLGLLGWHFLAPRSDMEKIQGDWRLTMLVYNGDVMREMDMMQSMHIVFKDDVVTLHLAPPGINVPPQVGRFRLDPSQSPKAMDYSPRGLGPAVPGIYELQGDLLRICLPEDQQNMVRPKEVKSPPGSKILLMVFKRIPEKR
jgi:RNA polymerase sigma factor (sigma-70 family)